MFTNKRKLIQFSYAIGGIFPEFWHVSVLQEFQEFQDQTLFYPLKWLACEYSCLIPAQYWAYFREKHVSAFLSLKIPKCLQLVVHSFSYYEWQTNDETSPRTNL